MKAQNIHQKPRDLQARSVRRQTDTSRSSARTVAALASGGAPVVDTTSHETADEYRLVITQHGIFRVIHCRDGIQFIVQKRKNGGAKRPWRSISYFTTQKALLRLCVGLNWPIGPDLEQLPDIAHNYSPETGGR